NTNPDLKLRAMWALHVTGGFSEAQLLETLNHNDEYVRAWAIQLLCEDKAPSAAALEKFNSLAAKDPSPVVRLYLASALQRISQESRWRIAETLLAHGEDAQDHNLPKIIWYGIEPLVANNADRVLALAAKSKIPMIARYIARRVVDANATESLVGQIGKKPETLTVMLEGMLDGLEGRTDIVTPAAWKSVY